jgi:adenosine kinase
MRILISGSLAFDRIMDFPGRFSDHILPDKIHILNVSFVVNGVKEQFGGTAGNIAYTLSLLGERPLILATAGTDFGTYENWLKSLGLPIEGIRRIPNEFTAGAYITTDQADNQITGFNPGAMKFQSLYDVQGEDPAQTLAITAPGNLEDMVGYSKSYRERSIRHIFDPGQQLPVLSEENQIEAITGSWMLISNDYELEMIMRTTGLDKSELLQRTEIIITTLGDRGALVSTATEQTHIPAARASQVLDPTGAGDAFRAGLIKGFALNKSLVESARMGAVSSSFSVQCQGTQCHRFNLEEFWARYEENYGPLS